MPLIFLGDIARMALGEIAASSMPLSSQPDARL